VVGNGVLTWWKAVKMLPRMLLCRAGDVLFEAFDACKQCSVNLYNSIFFLGLPGLSQVVRLTLEPATHDDNTDYTGILAPSEEHDDYSNNSLYHYVHAQVKLVTSGAEGNPVAESHIKKRFGETTRNSMTCLLVLNQELVSVLDTNEVFCTSYNTEHEALLRRKKASVFVKPMRESRWCLSYEYLLLVVNRIMFLNLCIHIKNLL
jgi:hypothetical protein